MTEAEFLSGRLLLAMPGMFDPRFDHAVIAMCVHDEDGALGIGIGDVRPGVSFRALLEGVGIDPGDMSEYPVLNGGPVEPQRGFVLHSDDWGGEGTIPITPLGALSGTLDVLRAIVEGRGPKRWLFALGYAGWGPGQLDNEMRHHGWYAAAGHPEVLFDMPHDRRWSGTWEAEGIDPALLASETGHA